MMVSTLSVFFSGSNITRLLKQGMAGHTVEIVDVSWMAKPCGRSSRCITFRTPPDFGVWLTAGPAPTGPGAAHTPALAAATLEPPMASPHTTYTRAPGGVADKTLGPAA